MTFRPTPLDPVPRPAIADAEVVGNVAVDRSVLVLVGGVTFLFWRVEDGAWTGGRAQTAERGHEIDERWITAARGVAAEALRRSILHAGGEGEVPSETIRCPECERLLCSSVLVDFGRVVAVDCGPEHVARTANGRELVFHTDGSCDVVEAVPGTSRSG